MAIAEKERGYSMIQEIEISKLRVHPKNVRKSYENIEELADSIKSQGILQNLTVVKNPEEEGTFWVVIGNRRLTAAIQAGLETAPCQIVEMDEKDQASTMLLENMQRNDLTIYEQAQGFQMVLDLGETEDGLSEKTGLSKSTIRHRVNIAKLDQKVLQEKEKDECFQLTLKDLYELEKIPDIKTRDKILKEASDSNNLASRARSCVEEMKRKENEKKLKNILKKKGIAAAPKGTENEMYSGKWETVKSYDLSKEPPKKLNVGDEDVEKLFFLVYWREIRIIKKKVKQKRELTPEEKARKEKDKRKRQLRAIQKEMAAQRKDFIKVVIEKNLRPEKPDYDSTNKRLFRLMLDCDCWMAMSAAYAFLSGEEETWRLSDEEKEKLNEKFRGLPLHQQLFICANKAVSDKDVSEWDASYHKGNGKIVMEFEDILADFGFSYEDEEFRKVSDGTHDLYS
ncbi:MAG: ParB/RepB/Spo0J family partition protein [Eubacteriales bacterium]|nr:ParB/RepB/Spo0J family partition protein [Eubacteriales bacterium]